MEKNKALYTLGILVLGFVVGFLIGPSIGQNSVTEKGMHRMSDGTVMNDMGHTMDSMSSGLMGKTGDDFDKAFLEEMIVHHEGAVTMAQMVLATSEKKELIDLANEIISAQTKEIDMMNGWLSEWF